jgi:type II secretion system protein I
MSRRRCGEVGFTLLEVIVATMIMAVAVVAFLGTLHTSIRNTDKLSDYDRAALFAQHKMDELLLDPAMPSFAKLGGMYLAGEDPGSSGWRAVVAPYEYPPKPQPGMNILSQVRLEVWWIRNGNRRTFVVDGFRRATLNKDDADRMTLNEHGANL